MSDDPRSEQIEADRLRLKAKKAKVRAETLRDEAETGMFVAKRRLVEVRTRWYPIKVMVVLSWLLIAVLATVIWR